MEIIVYDDCSTDGTEKLPWLKDIPNLIYIRGKKNVGVGNGFNAAIKAARGEIVIIFCADDIFCEPEYFKDVVCEFRDPTIGYISRYYYQFIDGKSSDHAVRAWRTKDPVIQANNPSGLAFRRKALKGCECSNKMFIETSQLASQVLNKGWSGGILKYDAVAVRVHASTSTRPGYWLKRRVSSPVDDWVEIGGKDIAKDYVSFIQIKNGLNNKYVFEEVRNFVKYRPINLFNPIFWFFAILALATPSVILRKIPDIYRRTWGAWTTGRVRRS
jgi:glycosyltransferase involved in cell wall biosynthesis